MRLTPVSYIILGLVRHLGEATPYALKAAAAESVGNLWTVQHAQLYTEPEKLAAAGMLTEEREDAGRRRRTYRITDAGREALDAWLHAPPEGTGETRDPGLLKLFFGADPAQLAPAEVERHERKLAQYEATMAAFGATMPQGPRLALEAGIVHQHTWLAYWRALAGAR
ncbi:MAG TPA: PadR family transcriptional regulator [Solirubrobacteraceae bacterium]|nr:PadR family transcriptional regulator [Solirubrobacteraceae bacterium]